ncbi:hypothetical protein A3A40_02570 [Candidatus Kaiserbacteria bacterium RIFCSPLOWO2_01_FULL_54_20]|uniref:LamG-like jellyroll fold domain-containing protein n=1 Tax=Candidatus Kaiserbacteria bacterium RIFCSPLOWO2_01_FULL_54_20 TaxID=1798513 RepID=A0A1F6EJP2_9BACT|nr:MAG: hypothetical protein A3A40_02570 [Candidatus Kaiserbacteria bacterium RIFCSPLOWO2_01_FULL_54_20]
MHNARKGFTRSEYLALTIAAIGALCITSIALADIVSGSFTTNTSTNISITNLTLSKPASVVAGDFMLANVTLKGGSAENVTAPAGWTQIRRTDNGTNVSIVSYWKVAGDSEPAAYTWTITPQTRAVGGITRYTGVDATNPIDTSSGNTGRSNVATAPSITTASSNEELVTLFAADARVQFSAPTGMVEKYDTSNGSSPSTAEDDSLQAAAGATGPKTATISSSRRNWAAQLVALHPANIFPPFPVAYWKFDESGGNAPDTTSNNNILTNNNGATYQAGKMNNGALLVPASNQYFSIDDALQRGLDLTSDFSASFWVKLNSLPGASAEYRVFSKQDGSSSNNSYNVMIGSGAIGDNQIYVFWSDDGSVGQTGQSHLGEYDGPADYFISGDVGNWVHIAIVADVANQSVTVYKNNIPTTLTKRGGSNASSIFNGTSPLTIGSVNIDSTPVRILDGEIDELGIWNRKLTSGEVSTLYNGGNGISL